MNLFIFNLDLNYIKVIVCIDKFQNLIKTLLFSLFFFTIKVLQNFVYMFYETKN